MHGHDSPRTGQRTTTAALRTVPAPPEGTSEQRPCGGLSACSSHQEELLASHRLVCRDFRDCKIQELSSHPAHMPIRAAAIAFSTAIGISTQGAHADRIVRFAMSSPRIAAIKRYAADASTKALVEVLGGGPRVRTAGLCSRLVAVVHAGVDEEVLRVEFWPRLRPSHDAEQRSLQPSEGERAVAATYVLLRPPFESLPLRCGADLWPTQPQDSQSYRETFFDGASTTICSQIISGWRARPRFGISI